MTKRGLTSRRFVIGSNSLGSSGIDNFDAHRNRSGSCASQQSECRRAFESSVCVFKCERRGGKMYRLPVRSLPLPSGSYPSRRRCRSSLMLRKRTSTSVVGLSLISGWNSGLDRPRSLSRSSVRVRSPPSRFDSQCKAASS